MTKSEDRIEKFKEYITDELDRIELPDDVTTKIMNIVDMAYTRLNDDIWHGRM